MATSIDLRADSKMGVPFNELMLWYTLFCVASVSMQLMNKLIATSFRDAGVTSLDNLLMATQQAISIILNFVCVCCIGGETWRIRPVTLAQVGRLIVPTMNFAAMLLCSLKALKTVHVATVVVARNLCTVLICVGELLVFHKPVSKGSAQSLLVILLGSTVYGFNDLSFEGEGYFWQGLNSVFFVVGQLYEKWAMDKSSDQTALGVGTIKNSLSLPILFLMHCVQEADPFAAIADARRLPALSWAIVVATGVGCCGLTICYMMLYKLSSATAVTVGGNFNKVVAIIFGAVLFRSPLGLAQSLGLAICLGGSLYYSICSISVASPKKQA